MNTPVVAPRAAQPLVCDQCPDAVWMLASQRCAGVGRDLRHIRQLNEAPSYDAPAWCPRRASSHEQSRR